ncbi:hypothetical protein [Allosphingosinicella vermicomposti]|uniref:hypothetical protein n=1 Tax=Allosphingosinicella vermicomposti TaxID=614671 RepID=UPI000D0E5AD3|nr:hypothetical protein [Allosphingosinicella vermicomposti]
MRFSLITTVLVGASVTAQPLVARVVKAPPAPPPPSSEISAEKARDMSCGQLGEAIAAYNRVGQAGYQGQLAATDKAKAQYDEMVAGSAATGSTIAVLGQLGPAGTAAAYAAGAAQGRKQAAQLKEGQATGKEWQASFADNQRAIATMTVLWDEYSRRSCESGATAVPPGPVVPPSLGAPPPGVGKPNCATVPEAARNACEKAWGK